MEIAGKKFDLDSHTYICGILNVTADSFSDGGKYNSVDKALSRVEQMIKDGTDIVDIGGESTRPGYVPISADEECERVLPVIESVKANFDVPISLDTYKPSVAKAGIEAGADIINDIWGLKYSKDSAGGMSMAEVIAAYSAPCILMHNREKQSYVNLIEDVKNDLIESVKIAKAAGISKDSIILDPGIGFAKSVEDNLKVLNHLSELFGEYHWLLGASRKSVIGASLNLPVDQRLEGTLALTALAVERGACMVRVHDILENRRVIDMLECVKREAIAGDLRR